MKKRRIFLLLFAVMFFAAAYSQNVGINQTGAAPDSSAMLDVSATNKGLLVPRVNLLSLTDAVTIPSPANSLMVYNTNAGLSSGVGYYYNSGSAAGPAWTKFMSGQSLGQSAASYYTTAPITITAGGALSYLPGFPVFVNVPLNSTAIMTINAAAQTSSISPTGFSIVDIYPIVDAGTSSGFQRLQIDNSAAIVSQIRYASSTQTLVLIPGVHSFGIAAQGVGGGGSNCTVGGNSSSLLQSNITLTILKN